MLFRKSTASKVPEAASPQTGVPGQAEALLRRLEWTVIRRLDGLLQGDYRTLDRKSTRLNSSHVSESRMPSSA